LDDGINFFNGLLIVLRLKEGGGRRETGHICESLLELP